MTTPNKEKKAFVITRDPDFRETLIPSIDELGYNITVQEDGSNIFSSFGNDLTSALIVIDLEHSDKTGSEFCRIIQESCVGKYQTLVLIFGRNDPQIDNASVTNADLFLFKPVDPKLLKLQLFTADRRRRDLLELFETQNKTASYRRELDLMEQQYEEALSRANSLTVESEISRLELDQIFKTVAGCIMLIDRERNIIRANDAISEITGLTGKELITKKCFETSLCGCCHTSECPFARIQAGKTRVEIEIQKAFPNGEIAYYIITATPLRTFGPEFMGIVVFLTDITERVKAEKALMETKEALKISEEKFRQLSIVDDLTGLFNKRRLNEQLEMEISRAARYDRPLSLLLMDIDNFKLINDTFGHSQGDQVLAGLAKMVKGCIRKSDIAFRYGGEEFIVILPETPLENCTKIAEKIRLSCTSLYFPVNSSEEIIVTLSIGATQYISDESESAFIARADQNMYLAKKGGKNRVVCDVGSAETGNKS